jgi:CheY-like chemotaxis protein
MYLDLLDRFLNPMGAAPRKHSGKGSSHGNGDTADSSGDEASPQGQAAPQRPDVKDRSTICVLVVDDNVAARYALARGMRHLGFRTAEAGTGAEAMDLARLCSAVLLDVNLPDVFGTEVCKLLRSKPETATMPIFHVSSAPLSEHKLQDVDVECADGYFVTPADLDQLAEAIERLLAARGLA